MQVVCSKCSRALDYSGTCPSFCAYCGQALPDNKLHTPSSCDPDAPTQALAAGGPVTPVGQTIGGYRLGRELGAGGMGAVYEAEEIATGRRVAIKLIKPEFGGSPDSVERFRQEGRIASLVAHPRCVFVLAVDEEAGRPYIVMELMPGSTLKELVEEQGPRPPEQALSKILDVIEGLQAAHRLEVIHRDVKPSNCFLEADGRVKVGDFGLAKSLVRDMHLTKTGAFVGTPYFASPEQIRSEPIDAQTDVYAVAATLYYLLTGRPPFMGADMVATVALVAMETPPPMRQFRSELDPALDRVVLRGLERDRSKRWPDLESFRQALLALFPEPLSREGMVRRLAAGLLDGALLALVFLGLLAVLPIPAAGPGTGVPLALVLLLSLGLGVLVVFWYFLLFEQSKGGSLGKKALGLRVCSHESIGPPNGEATAKRTLLFIACVPLGALPAALILSFGAPRSLSAPDWLGIGIFAGWGLVGSLLLAATMRERNGYLGLHEAISGTRVVQPVQPRPRDRVLDTGGWLLSFLLSRRLDQGLAQAGPLPPRISGFAIRGALKWTAADKVLLGEDASLGRRVFLWLRPPDAPPLPAARRDIGRRTRLRWLGCGKQGELQWDAILAPLGCPLPEFVHGEGTLAWRDAKLLLAELAGELAAAVADGTLPPSLAETQVWVQGDGRAQLADIPLTAAAEEEETSAGTDQERALGLLARVAALVLEGKPRSLQGRAMPLRASVPPEARKTCERLLGVGDPYQTVAQLQEDLKKST
jgi:uncharacterized RDD family membrane protein YckC